MKMRFGEGGGLTGPSRSRPPSCSSEAGSLLKSTRNLRPIISWSFRLRTAEAAESERPCGQRVASWGGNVGGDREVDN